MALPLVVAGVASGVSQLGAAIFGGKSRKNKRRARQARANITKIQNYQQKRKFINNFFQAQGAALSRGVASGAGLDSSAVQGTLASQTTQTGVGLFEVSEQDRFSALSDTFEKRASKNQGIASGFGVANNLISLGVNQGLFK